ncbi:uncharacterized protein LOC117317038 [Pecten maximus]|uniref:uncharacterized protein LOC117317038 n=1 Tax=Pecten maximus TaxID=6579 RepID=UPI001458239D|nr:uncharacterized protein LOC117317038 [Pecten maximus]
MPMIDGKHQQSIIGKYKKVPKRTNLSICNRTRPSGGVTRKHKQCTKMAAAEENLREIYPNPGSKTKSDVWKFFGFYKINDNEPPSKKNLDTTQAVCRLCRKIYRNTGNTTNFRAHIDGEHKLPSGNST